MPTKTQLDKLSWQWTATTPPENVDRTHVELAYRVSLASCRRDACRRNCKGNPNCLVGLGEKEWLSEIAEERWHEIDEPDLERRAKDSFVGLKNLGATCYVNTFLQVWFHNHSFRAALYKWRPPHRSAGVPPAKDQSDVDGQPAGQSEDSYVPTCICGHLQSLFALMQFTNRRFIDPSGLVNCLGLDAALQQDAQEFSKLFMSLLEERLSQQTNPEVRRLIQQQFCGHYAYVTRCNNCGHSSERPSQFYELDLNVKGHRELRESLGEFLQDEPLEGANQYFCDRCMSKQNATRRIQLLGLPPVLNIQLLRFIFDRQTGTKKKLNSYIQFPEMLNLTPYLLRKDAEAMYELTAVLIHRGPTAYSGHYVAHIREEGAWHKFNDEDVEKIEGRNLKLGSEEDWQGGTSKQGKRPRSVKGSHSSKNAYMLVYKKLTNEAEVNPPPCHAAPLVLDTLPNYLQDLVLSDRQSFDEWAADMTSMRERSIARGKAKHQEITALYLNLSPTEGGAYEWLPTDWLRQWLNADSNAPADRPLDVSDMLCCHGNLDPDKVCDVKRVSQETAQGLVSQYGRVGPKLTGDSLCLVCVREQCQLIRLKSSLVEDCKFVAGATKTKLDSGESGCWVGKSSLRDWRNMALRREQRRGAMGNELSRSEEEEGGEEEEEGSLEEGIFNEDILCPHGSLSTDESLRKLVPVPVWERLHAYFPDAVRFTEEDSDGCHICRAIDEKEKRDSDLRVLLANGQKAALSKLLSDRHRPPRDMRDVVEAFAVARPFLERWREFVRQPLRNAPQGNVENALLVCEHDRFVFEPGAGGDVDVQLYSLVWPHEWHYIADNFTVDFTIRLFWVPASVEDATPRALRSEPEACWECIVARQSQASRHRQEYSGARIYIRKITAEVALSAPSLMKDGRSEMGEGAVGKDPDFFQANGNKRVKLNADVESTRRSCRHRKVRGEKEVIVSSTNTLKELKIKVMHAFSVAPFDQTLFLGSQQLSDDNSSLTRLGIEPECIVTLRVDTPPCDDSLAAEEIYRASNVPEAGFKGTGLLGSSRSDGS